MPKNLATSLVGLAILAFFVSTSLVQPAFAKNDDSEKELKKEMKIEQLEDKIEWRLDKVSTPDKSVVIRDNGDFRVTGVVVNSVNVDAKTLNVSLYGFSRDVYVGDAKLSGRGGALTLADFRAGDKLSATGNWNQSTRAISVKEVRNLSVTGKSTSDLQKRIDELMEMVRKLQEQMRNAR